jgi:hypothetical protein
MTPEQRTLLERVAAEGPEYSLNFYHPDVTALRDADLIDLYDLSPNGDARWTITIEGRAALKTSKQT